MATDARLLLVPALLLAPACNAIFGLDDLEVQEGAGASGASAGTASGSCSPDTCPAAACEDPVCEGGACAVTPKAAGATCAEAGGSVCNGSGQCVECVTGADCASGACDANACIEVDCDNAVIDGNETDVDCGGACPPCSPGKTCEGGIDCLSGVCTGGVCQEPTCVDGVDNGPETDVDCGSTCPPCDEGQTCVTGTDCLSGICDVDTCAASACSDGLKNGGESDTDCGGPCPGCMLGGVCVDGGDCDSGLCKASLCALLNGCAPADAVDLTGQAMVTINFSSQAYTPDCFRVSAGTEVTFQGSFNGHDLYGGEVVGAQVFPDSGSPFMPPTTSGGSKTFTLSAAGNYPFYCGPHWDNGMKGAAFVEP